MFFQVLGQHGEHKVVSAGPFEVLICYDLQTVKSRSHLIRAPRP